VDEPKDKHWITISIINQSVSQSASQVSQSVNQSINQSKSS